jgi:hypothetical protein
MISAFIAILFFGLATGWPLACRASPLNKKQFVRHPTTHRKNDMVFGLFSSSIGAADKPVLPMQQNSPSAINAPTSFPNAHPTRRLFSPQ